MSLTASLSALGLDIFPISIGKGELRAKAVRIDSGIAVPVWIRLDLSPLKVYRFDSLPIDIPTYATFIEALSYDPNDVNTGNTYYVATTGSTSNTGAIGSPWTLAYALAGAGGVIAPGDTIYIRGGTYTGPFVTTGTAGTKAGRIVYRQYGGDAPLGERVRLDGSTEITRAYTDLRGVEIFMSDPNAIQLNGCILGSSSADTTASRLINCIVHDCGNTGTTHWLNAHGAVHYGVISYNNGTNHNLDHGYYTHDSQYALMNCVSFNNLARGFQAYDSQRVQDQVIFRNLISFGAGEISTRVNRAANYQMRVISPQYMDRFSFEDCVGSHKPPDGDNGYQIRAGSLGYISGNRRMTIRRFFGQTANVTVEINEWQNLTVEDINVSGSGPTQPIVLLRATPSASVSWARNTWYRAPTANAWTYQSKKQSFANWVVNSGLGATDTATSTPFTTRYFLFPNDYSLIEGVGRGHLAIFNPTHAATVPVDLSPVLRVGQSFQISNVQDLWGTPVLTGVWDGTHVDVPMTGVTPPTPGGASRVYATPPTTAPDFDAFVVLQV